MNYSQINNKLNYLCLVITTWTLA